MKLWAKDYTLNKEIEKFSVGDDYLLDQKLFFFDCIASIAHANMLNKIKPRSQMPLSLLKEKM